MIFHSDGSYTMIILPRSGVFMTEYFQKHTLIFGTLFLTAAGFLSRVLGFFYRIFLSRTIGAEGLGLYQMIFPVYGICFSLCAGSIQTAISRFTAAKPEQAKQTLFTGFLISFSLALALALGIATHSDYIALHILMEPQCTPLLSAMALAIPCTAVHACICGYFYGKEKVQLPAVAQLLEQCVRIFTVFLIADIRYAEGRAVTPLVAVLGLAAGEAASALFVLLAFFIFSETGFPHTHFVKSGHISSRTGAWIRMILSSTGPLLTLAAPLMANRLVMNLMQSAEAIFIPNRLELFGLTASQSVSLYGVLTGMAMPFIMFPSAITNSLAVVLLPTVARQQAAGNNSGITKTLSLSVRYSLYIGILCIGIFTVFGEELGITVFKNQDAGTCITILAWLCPFLYLATTMGSVLNGLGKTNITFLHNFTALSIRLLFVFFGIPCCGILAYLWGMLASEILLVIMHACSLRKLTACSYDAWNALVKPACCLLTSLGIYRLFPESQFLLPGFPAFLRLGMRIGVVCVCYVLLLLLLPNRSVYTSSND